MAILAAGTEVGNESDDTLSVACQTAHLLAVKEPDMGKPLLTNNMVHALHHLSKNEYGPKAHSDTPTQRTAANLAPECAVGINCQGLTYVGLFKVCSRRWRGRVDGTRIADLPLYGAETAVASYFDTRV